MREKEEGRMRKEFEIGRVKVDGYKRRLRARIDIRLRKEKSKGLCLAISGEIMNPKLTDCIMAGQIRKELEEAYREGKLDLSLRLNRDKFQELMVIWKRWHLNDLRAGCTHQREIIRESGYDDCSYEEIKKTEFFVCPVCGYEYGSKWLLEELPPVVVDFLREI